MSSTTGGRHRTGEDTGMSITLTTRPTTAQTDRPSETRRDRYSAVKQYSRKQILGVWAAATVPMGVLAWIVAPWLGGRLGGGAPLAQALIICLTLGLVWQFALTTILVRRETGTFRWSRVRDALWLRAPRNPKTGRTGGRVWWWASLFVVLYGLVQLLPGIPGPSTRDFGQFVASDAGKAFFSGAWGWYGLLLVMFVFNTVLGEELLFRGLLLPRMQGAFGDRDYVANGVLFAVYHVHMPCSSSPVRPGASRAPGWASSPTLPRASSSACFSSPSCSPEQGGDPRRVAPGP
jgi:membrane protease YdiL (CAAX protease family)